MTIHFQTNPSWPSVSCLLSQIEDTREIGDLYAHLRIDDFRVEGGESSWRDYCREHKDEVDRSALEWSKTGTIPQCSEAALLLLRIRAVTARIQVLGLSQPPTKDSSFGSLPIQMFPFPDCSENTVAEFLLTEWWDHVGWGIAGRGFQAWAKCNPE